MRRIAVAVPAARRRTACRRFSAHVAETARALREDAARAVRNGEVDPGLDPWPAAVRLTAVTEGLAMQVYRAPDVSAGLTASIVRDELAAVFTGECRQYVSRGPAG
ncbi:TetR family transcriptional regulator C-terminal domain-containing protein [Spirillospora sp. NPDC052242]